ncbi:MAG: zinc-dependent metalloprotease [Saprospiraceae bacterium]|nr:zinc-dependent metalloprotease [Saprospiraceae bacterium]
MMNRLFFTACFLLLCGAFTAQAQHKHGHHHEHGHHHKHGHHDHVHLGHIHSEMTVEEQLSIRERMFENRRNKADLLANRFRSEDSITYIPMQFHLIAQANGTGRATIEQMLDNLCKINADFSSQKIQFYLAGPANFINNTSMYINDDRSLTGYMMDLFKVDGVVNIFIGQTITNNTSFTTLGYYTPQYDCIYAIRSELNGSSQTLTHELGHFFTLAHPFFGWEDQYAPDVIAANGGTTPLGVGGVTVENVARGTSDENCQWAADGFCDTKPNYNFGLYEPGCGLTIGTFYDPLGVMLEAPDADNHMSYYGEACANTFTSDQAQAIVLDVISRGYDRFEVPKIDITSTPSIIWPNEGEPPHYFQSFDLQWTAATGATYYHVTVRRYIGGSPGPVVVDQMVTGTSLWVSLDPNTQYGWTVKPVNNYDLDCADEFKTPVTQFTTGSWLSDVQETDVAIESSRIYPNPANQTSEIVLEINSTTNANAQVSIYNTLGQAVVPTKEVFLTTGTNVQPIDISALSAGMYIVNIETQEGRISHKLILND